MRVTSSCQQKNNKKPNNIKTSKNALETTKNNYKTAIINIALPKHNLNKLLDKLQKTNPEK